MSKMDYLDAKRDIGLQIMSYFHKRRRENLSEATKILSE